jgi:D-glycero-D-manno-heptose 1,7-bisphosphate phosphatase
MNEGTLVLTQAFHENPILGALVAVSLDGGRVISTGEISEGLLNMVPESLFFERKSIDDTAFVRNLTPRDLVFVEKLSVDQLWNLAAQTSAQIALITDKNWGTGLSDYLLQEKDLHSALLGLSGLLRKLEPFRKDFAFDGPRENAALFLDRDGVVIDDVDYIRDPSQVKIRPDVKETLLMAREKNFRIVIVTNQSGIGRGMISWHQYEQVTLRMQTLLAQEGLFVDRIMRAPFYEQSILAEGLVRRSLRKPRPGMIHQAASELRIDLSKSILIGDCASDLMAGVLAGIPNVYLLRSHRTSDELAKWRQWPLLSRSSIGLNSVEISSLKEVFQS